MKGLTVSKRFNEEGDNELLRHVVAVIESLRLQIAKQLNTVVMSLIEGLASCWKNVTR